MQCINKNIIKNVFRVLRDIVYLKDKKVRGWGYIDTSFPILTRQIFFKKLINRSLP